MFSTKRLALLGFACAALWSGTSLAQAPLPCFPDAANGNVDPACTQVGLTIPFDILPPAKSALARLSVGAAERVPRLARGVPLAGAR